MYSEYIRAPRIRLAGTVTYGDFRRSFSVDMHENIERSLPHSHACFELELVLSGEGFVNINGTEYPLSAGTVHLADPTDFHSIRTSVPLRILSLKFTDTTDAAARILGGQLRWFRFTDADAKKAESLLFVIREEQGNGATDGVAERCFEAFLQLTARYLPDAASDSAILRALRFIRENFREDIGEADIAAAAGYTPTHLSRRFREQIGIGVKAYLTSLRVDHARRLMDTTDLLAVDIAADAGFGSYSAFFRAFTEAVGMSPAAYQEKRRI